MKPFLRFLSLLLPIVVLTGCSQSFDRFSQDDEGYNQGSSRSYASSPPSSSQDRVERSALPDPGYGTGQSSYQKASLPPPSQTDNTGGSPQWRGASSGTSSAYNSPPNSGRTSSSYGGQGYYGTSGERASTPYGSSYTTPSRYTPPPANTTAAPQGQTTLVVQQGQTAFSIARAYNISVRDLATANSLPSPYRLQVGQRLVIPGRSSPRAPTSQGAIRIHQVKQGETLFSVGRTYGINPYQIADFNGFSKDHAVKIGEMIKIPAQGSSPPARQTTTASVRAPTPGAALEKSPQTPSASPKPQTMASAQEPLKTQEKPQSTPSDSKSQQNRQAQTAPTEEKNFELRWPVQGRVISKFGTKPNGTLNMGINIAVPEGTNVKAAQSGAVILVRKYGEGYGNLILIQHADGWRTIYAHNKEILVKEGQQVNRGDVIAKAGQTGSVNSPQLHFELRKGNTLVAVDPIPFFSSSSASR